MSARTIPPALLSRCRIWLGKKGHDFFSKVKAEHGDLNAVWMEGSIPHSVHFTEGMTVRNWMRLTGLCDGWDCCDFDDNWMTLIEMCIALPPITNKAQEANA